MQPYYSCYFYFVLPKEWLITWHQSQILQLEKFVLCRFWKEKTTKPPQILETTKEKTQQENKSWHLLTSSNLCSFIKYKRLEELLWTKGLNCKKIFRNVWEEMTECIHWAWTKHLCFMFFSFVLSKYSFRIWISEWQYGILPLMLYRAESWTQDYQPTK